MLLGGAATATLAGCTEDDPEYENGGSSNGENDGDDGPQLEILEHELVIEQNLIDDVRVEGIVENQSDEMLSYVEVRVRVYDEDGNQLDRYFTNTSDLDAGQTWAFEVMILEDADDVADYDIVVTDSPF